MPPRPSRPVQAFTIIEMLTVMAIIGILAAILIPTVTGSNTSAKRAKTKVQFAQWATAIEGFKQEYGYYPQFTQFPAGRISTDADTSQFIQTLTGKKPDGSSLATGDLGLVAGNTKRISFCSFGTSDLTSATNPLLQDAFGNTEIVVLMDKNQDGLIRVNTGTATDDYAAPAPTVRAVGGNTLNPPDMSQPIRASVAIYSAGDGQQAVKSW